MSKIKKSIPRGYRNCNPCNIRKNPNNHWLGEIMGDDPSFCTFVDNFHGLRAALKILFNYNQKYRINTLSGIISRWAPQNENDTQRYIDFVSRSACIPSCEPLAFTYGECCAILKAMCIVENGYLYNKFYEDFANVWKYMDVPYKREEV